MKTEISKKLLRDLDKLLDFAGDSYGLMILEKLITRLDKTAKLFESESKELILKSFKKYHYNKEKSKTILKNGSFKNQGFNKKLRFEKLDRFDLNKNFEKKAI